MVKIKSKLYKTGSGYALGVPKALIDSEILKKGLTYEFDIKAEVWPEKTPESQLSGSLNKKARDKGALGPKLNLADSFYIVPKISFRQVSG